MKKKNLIIPIILCGLIMIFNYSCKKSDTDKTVDQTPIINPNTVTDIDGNVYHTITIGTQVWMVENLRAMHYRNGDAILYITDGVIWGNTTAGAYTSGSLYNYYAVQDSRNLAPKGWHIPSHNEWITLVNYLGGDSIAGGKLKETGTSDWDSPNTGATNSSGFTALPDGGFGKLSLHFGIGTEGYWWCSSYCAAYCIEYNSAHVYLTSESELCIGYSVRCVKD